MKASSTLILLLEIQYYFQQQGGYLVAVLQHDFLGMCKTASVVVHYLRLPMVIQGNCVTIPYDVHM
jgi:hypothetical protein